MKLSIGIPVHDAIDCTLRAIDCVAAACRELGWLHEIHVIDDNSTPENHSRLEERLRLLQDCKFVTTQSRISNPAPNLAFNVNYLLDNVAEDADYYLNLETDVFVNAEALNLLKLRLEENSDVCMTFPKQLTPNGERADFHFCQRGYPLVGAIAADLVTDMYFRWTHMGCTMIRGEHARDKEIRADESFKLFCCDQDYSLCLRQATGKHILYVASAHVLHAAHASSREGLTPNVDPECFARVDARWQDLLSCPP